MGMLEISFDNTHKEIIINHRVYTMLGGKSRKYVLHVILNDFPYITDGEFDRIYNKLKEFEGK